MDGRGPRPEHPTTVAAASPYAGAAMPSSIPAAEVSVDARLVRRLVREQHPDLAGLPLRPLGNGWDTVVYRLGRDLTVRMPRRELGARAVAGELRWLPHLAAALPLPVSEPVRAGQPSRGFPWQWSICRYVPGRPVAGRGCDGAAGRVAAVRLAGFLRALHTPAPPGAPTSGWRGVPLAVRDATVRTALAGLDPADARLLLRRWQDGCSAPDHPGPAQWLHGDLHGLNVLAVRGRISGVVDFGDLCAGDPATDLAVAWAVLDGPARHQLREACPLDPAAWARGSGWAAFFATMFLAHSLQAPQNHAIGRRILEQLAGDPG